MQDQFVNRHIGVNKQELSEMLRVIGVKSVGELIDQVVPPHIRLKQELSIGQGYSEAKFADHIREIASKNKVLRSLIGLGYYGTASPAVIIRNVFENPAWYTSYTPYQAEISQGRLEALLNFQTAIISLTGMEISNCSLLDESTAAAEAMHMMFAQRSRNAVKEQRNVLLVDENIFPQTIDLLLTRSEPLGIELAIDNIEEYQYTGLEFGAIVQYPCADGKIVDYTKLAATCHQKEMLVTAAVDILALALIESPANWGADIVVGSTQRLGIPMGYGGPAAGYLATKEEYKRNMPGRIIGVSIDRLGNKALRMALQTREQHIKREKATSNICTAQALLATMAGMYAVYHGKEGLQRIALNAHSHAAAIAQNIEKLGFKVKNHNFFDTIEIIEIDQEKLQTISVKHGFNFGYFDEYVRISCDELTTLEEVNKVLAIFAEYAGVATITVDKIEEKIHFDKKFERQTDFLTEEVFKNHRSETKLMRYIKKLEVRDISLANSMISLGSCTMKLNSAVSMMPLSLVEFGNIHPFVPKDQALGYQELIKELDKDLSNITGFAKMSFQPNSGAAGEYAGLMVIRAYHISKGQHQRDVAMIPASAHGTNPASAAMAGMQVVVTKCDENGNIDLDHWKSTAAQYADRLSCCMITYPSTHGIFESKIIELIDTIHSYGGQVYYDGANMNAVVGLTSPGEVGADVCHLNLHKTFSIPHGGGGPGVGCIGVAKHLVEFLPSHPMVECGGKDGITAVASAPYGSAMVLPITYAYIKMLGGEGLKRASEMAIVNANYMACALKGEIEIVYSGETGRVGHEMILDYRRLRQDFGGVECGDIARRLMDFGFHAPTLSFPVHDTLMVEPTECESKAELDRFIGALLTIKKECQDNIGVEDHIVKNAPHTASEIVENWNHSYSAKQAAYPLAWVKEFKFWPYVTKIDGGYGDRNLICTCAPLEEYL